MKTGSKPWCYNCVSIPTGQHITIELSLLEEEQSSISPDYDHISYLVQKGSTKILIFLKCLRNNFVYLVDSCLGTLFYAGNIYVVVSLRANGWVIQYWLTCCLDGKQTLIVSLRDSKGNGFPSGSMVIRGEYLT